MDMITKVVMCGHHIVAKSGDQGRGEGEAAPGSTWHATQWANTTSTQRRNEPGLREVTLRSMMGDFGGNAGLLSAWFDLESGDWKYEIQMCSLGVQHIWWAVHKLDIVAVSLGLIWLSLKARRFTVSTIPGTTHTQAQTHGLDSKKSDNGD